MGAIFGDCRRVRVVLQVLFCVAVAADRVGLFLRELETIGFLTSNEKRKLFASRRLGARGHALWGTGAGAVSGAVRFRCWCSGTCPVLARVLRSGAIGAAVVGCWRWCGRIWMAGC